MSDKTRITIARVAALAIVAIVAICFGSMVVSVRETEAKNDAFARCVAEHSPAECKLAAP